MTFSQLTPTQHTNSLHQLYDLLRAYTHTTDQLTSPAVLPSHSLHPHNRPTHSPSSMTSSQLTPTQHTNSLLQLYDLLGAYTHTTDQLTSQAVLPSHSLHPHNIPTHCFSSMTCSEPTPTQQTNSHPQQYYLLTVYIHTTYQLTSPAVLPSHSLHPHNRPTHSPSSMTSSQPTPTQQTSSQPTPTQQTSPQPTPMQQTI